MSHEKSGRGEEGVFPRGFRGSMAPPTPPELGKSKFLWF